MTAITDIEKRIEQEKEKRKNNHASDPASVQAKASAEEVAALKELAASLVADGELSKEDLDTLTAAIDAQEVKARLSDKERAEILDTVSEGVRKNDTTKVSKVGRVFGILSLVFGALTLAVLGYGLYILFTNGSHVVSSYQGSTVELVLYIIGALMLVAGSILHVFLGVRLLKGTRYGAAKVATALMLIGACGMFLETMLTGISLNLLFVTLITAFRVVLAAYLSPSLARERELAENMRMADTKNRFENGTLGLDLDGKGYIKLDFFNIFWIFVVASVLGLIVEVIWHMVVVDPGVYENRPGLLFGPFSPIYGVGAVLMTMAVNRHQKAGLIPIFIICTIIGGAFEYFVSWWMEVSFGVIAWDYSNEFLNIEGRTCLWFASMFGLLGLWWSKWALPRLLWLINRIPWKIRYSVTAVCAVLMLLDIGMTLQAMDCWQERVNGKPVVTEVQQFYAENYDNDTMQSIFQNMTVTPQKDKTA